MASTEREAAIIANMLRERLEQDVQAFMDYTQEIPSFTKVVLLVKECFENRGKLLFCGNGGAAAASCHAVDDFMVAVYKDHPMPTISLVDNMATLTATANDFGYETIFSRQVRALGRPGDILFAISTSGNSANVLQAVEMAQAIGLTVVGLTSKPGGLLGKAADVWLPSTTSHSQVTEEVHLVVLHMIANCVARLLFPSDAD